MGGITEKLYINGRILRELNFSCDPEATNCVLQNAKKISIITGNHCLNAYFTEKQFRHRLESNNKPIAQYIFQKCIYWFENMMRRFEIDGFHNWNVVAVAYFAEPTLFKDNLQFLKHDLQKLKQGMLSLTCKDKSDIIVNLPKIYDLGLFTEDIYKSWLGVEMSSVGS